MIVGVGVDIVENERILKASLREEFSERVFTDNERREAKGHEKRLAGDFAAKEAVSKCFGTGFRGFGLKDIEVLRLGNGAPYVTLYGGARNISDKLKITGIHISISDTKEHTIAMAVAESNEKT